MASAQELIDLIETEYPEEQSIPKNRVSRRTGSAWPTANGRMFPVFWHLDLLDDYERTLESLVSDIESYLGENGFTTGI
jgi:hypothetical protein